MAPRLRGRRRHQRASRDAPGGLGPGVVPNTVTFTKKRSPCAGGDVQERDESLERDGLTNKRRVGRLEAVALERPQIQLVVELILSIELGHEVLDRRRRLRGPVRRVMCTISYKRSSRGAAWPARSRRSRRTLRPSYSIPPRRRSRTSTKLVWPARGAFY